MEAKYRMKMSMTTVPSTWRGYESTCTTGDFRNLGRRGFKRHCGPTAAANIVLAFTRRYCPAMKLDQTETFLTCAKVGQRSLLYGNADILGHFGGTSDLLAPLYLSLCFQKCRCPAKVANWQLLTEHNVRKALGRGSLLYVEIRHHPRYHDHHFVCYVAQEVREPDGRQVAFFLMCADGWDHGLTPIALNSIKWGTFYEIVKT